jgi:transcription antitermination factor NusG
LPLLPLDTFLHPEDLFAGEARHDLDKVWWVLHTRPRAEKALAQRILRRDLAFFLPLAKRQWRSRGRLLCSYSPLFPGYVFLHGDRQARSLALETNLVARVLPVVNQQQLVDDLERVHRLMNSGVALSPEDRLQPGMRVEIVSGPLAGLEGKVLQRDKQLRFFVEVRMLQRGVSVEIDGWMLQPVSEVPRATCTARTDRNVCSTHQRDLR